MLVEKSEANVYDFRDNHVPGSTDRDRAYWRDVGTLDSFYEANMDLPRRSSSTGRRSNAIIDKNVVVPDGTEIGVHLERDRTRYTVSDDDVVVIGKG
jgi:ADP-glucose pyrophosphorylase